MSMTIGSIASARMGLRSLAASSGKVESSIDKISSGQKINQAKDNPAGLIISEMLRAQAAGTEQAIQNTNEANNLLSIAEGGLGSIQDNLTRMRSLAIHAMNSGITTSGQTAADQGVMDSLLSTIGRTAGTVNYAGENLLNGADELTYNVHDNHDILAAADFTSVPERSGTLNVAFAGGEGAQAEKAYLESDFGTGQATLAADQSFTVGGNDGTYTFSFAAGTSIADMAEAINSRSDSTGINAYAIRDHGDGATELRLVSNDYGAAASVRVQQNEGDAFAAAGDSVYDLGRDATVTVNGRTVRTRGLEANVADGDLRVDLRFNGEGDAGQTTIAQTGYDRDELVNAEASRSARLTNFQGGLQLQLGGGESAADRTVASLPDAGLGALGRVTEDGRTYSLADLAGGGAASLANNPELALRVIDQAITDVASARGGIGAYQANTLATNANNLAIQFANLTSTESFIRDTDLAREITELTQSRIQRQAGLKAIQNANQQARDLTLSLLGGVQTR